MTRRKILISDGLHESGQSLLREAAEVDDRSGISHEELLQIIHEYDVLIVRSRTRVNAALFAAAEQLKVVGRAGVGVDNIDLAAANAHRVIVINAPQATIVSVAEHTLAMMLALARAIPYADANIKSGRWLKNQLIGVELQGKVLGILGMGKIGSAVALRASAFGMKILGYDPYIAPEEIQQRGAAPVTLSDLYANSDFISLHLPFSPETRNMINGQALGQMKRGVRIICTARGGIIDETALLGALESGQVAGAALDVFAKEPPGMSALIAHPNVITTPHIAAQTYEAQARAAVDIAYEVLSALRGEPLRWRVI
jgi:D-3-phosphoglycerate dehydrogenase